MPPVRPRAPIPNYLVQSILAAVFCYPWIFGIVAIAYATQVNGKIEAGDLVGAQNASDKARTWCFVALCVAVALLAVYALLAVM